MIISLCIIIFHYEYALWNVSTIQLMHLTCRKYLIQSPTRKKGWDLFQRTSDDNLINMNLKLPGLETPWRKKEIHRAVDPPQRMKTTMGIRDNSRWRKECYERSYDQRITNWSWGMMYTIWFRDIKESM